MLLYSYYLKQLQPVLFFPLSTSQYPNIHPFTPPSFPPTNLPTPYLIRRVFDPIPAKKLPEVLRVGFDAALGLAELERVVVVGQLRVHRAVVLYCIVRYCVYYIYIIIYIYIYIYYIYIVYACVYVCGVGEGKGKDVREKGG